MSEAKSFERDRNRAWYGMPTETTHIECPNCGHSIIEKCRYFFDVGFSRGGSWSIKRTTEYNTSVTKFVELLTWLAIQDESFVKTLKRIVLGEIVEDDKSSFSDITPQIEYWKERGDIVEADN